MNKSTRLLLLAFVLLAGAWWVISRKPWRTAPKAADAFAIEDTASVTRVFLADKMGQRIFLERQPDQSWTVNGKFAADLPKVRLLLATLHDQRIQMPIPASMHNTAMSVLASRGVKTEVYAGDQLLKTIYIGSETPDKTGTFALMEGEDDPYSLHVPGFVGFLTPRFFTTEIKWRSKLLFDIPFDQLQEVSMTYPSDPAASFRYDATTFAQQRKLYNNNNQLVATDTLAVNLFAHAFSAKYVEGYYDDSTFTPRERDSLFQLTPYCIIRWKSASAQNFNSVTLYNKPIGSRTKERYDETGMPLTIDPEKFYARMEGVAQVASVQEYVLRPVLRKAAELIR